MPSNENDSPVKDLKTYFSNPSVLTYFPTRNNTVVKSTDEGLLIQSALVIYLIGFFRCTHGYYNWVIYHGSGVTVGGNRKFQKETHNNLHVKKNQFFSFIPLKSALSVLRSQRDLIYEKSHWKSIFTTLGESIL